MKLFIYLLFLFLRFICSYKTYTFFLLFSHILLILLNQCQVTKCSYLGNQIFWVGEHDPQAKKSQNFSADGMTGETYESNIFQNILF